MSEGGAFAEYREGEILFRPTYKFDSKVPTEAWGSVRVRVKDKVRVRASRWNRNTLCKGTLTLTSKVPTEYDHSEKQRIPAYTDRVLYRGEGNPDPNPNPNPNPNPKPNQVSLEPP